MLTATTSFPFRTKAGVGVATLTCALCLVLCGSAQGTTRTSSQLRRAFGEVMLALRVTGNPAACSLATAQGRTFLIQKLRGETRYLRSTTCHEAFAQDSTECGPSANGVAAFKRVIGHASVRISGNHATIQLVDDVNCDYTHPQADPLAVSRWVKKRHRWLFNNEPTGTYSAAGRRSAALLRAALSGGSVNAIFTGLPTPNEDDVSLCSSGTSQLHFAGNFIPSGGTWYVAGGFSGSRIGAPPGPPFDAQGNPQSELTVLTPMVLEWDLKLIGGAVDVSPPPITPADPTAFSGSVAFQPDSAGC